MPELVRIVALRLGTVDLAGAGGGVEPSDASNASPLSRPPAVSLEPSPTGSLVAVRDTATVEIPLRPVELFYREAEMTSAWITVIVAIVSGLAGTMLRISHDRGAELRSRMLNAADEFSIAVVAALSRMRNTAGEVIGAPPRPLITRPYTVVFEKELDEVNDAVADALEKLARVHLLFGDLSNTGRTARAVVDHLRNMDMALNQRPDSIRTPKQRVLYNQNTEQAVANHGDFNRAALRALRDSNPKRFGRWLRVAPRRLFGWLRGLWGTE
jgi:hypothetical protein